MKKLGIFFNHICSYSETRRENQKYKQSVMDFADDFYAKTLLKKGVQGFRTQGNISKLYGIFQAWKYHVKESRLLKKYLDEADSDLERDTLEQTSRFQGLASQISEDIWQL